MSSDRLKPWAIVGVGALALLMGLLAISVAVHGCHEWRRSQSFLSFRHGKAGPKYRIGVGLAPEVSPQGVVYFTLDNSITISHYGSAYWSCHELFCCSLDGSNRRRVELGKILTLGVLFEHDPSLCYVHYVVPRRGDDDPNEYVGLYKIKDPYEFRLLRGRMPHIWSPCPDGSKVVKWLADPVSSYYGLVVAQVISPGVAGRTLCTIPSTIPYEPWAWASNSDSIAFGVTTVDSQGTSNSVRILRFDTGESKEVLKVKGKVIGITWSPNDKWLCALVEDDSYAHLDDAVLINLHTGASTPVLKCTSLPMWTPDMSYLLYERDGTMFLSRWSDRVQGHAL